MRDTVYVSANEFSCTKMQKLFAVTFDKCISLHPTEDAAL